MDNIQHLENMFRIYEFIKAMGKYNYFLIQ